VFTRYALALGLLASSLASGRAAAWGCCLTKKPVCPPCCSPTYGFYPTAWRAWPSVTPDGYLPGGVAPQSLPAPEDKPADVGHRAAGGSSAALSGFRLRQ
jgi:hypothetical protein